MQAELCGFALAVGPNEACYVPLGHRQGGEGGNGTLFRGDVVPDQISEGDALEALKPLLTDAGVLKIGEDFKFDWQVLALRGIEIAPYDDTQLMSYVVDAGRADHGLGGLAQTFDHAAIDLNELIKAGKTRITFDCVAVNRATEYAAEAADVALRLWRVLKPRLAAERVLNVYETVERPLVSVLARMERRGISIDRQVLSRLSESPGGRGPRSRDQADRRRGHQPRQPEATRRRAVRQARPARRHQDPDRPMVDRRARSRGPRRAGPRAAAERSSTGGRCRS